MDDAMEEIRLRFLAEAEDLVAELEDGLAILTSGDAPAERGDALEGAFRAAHTIKGNAGMFGMSALAAAAHGLEDQLAALRDRGSRPEAVGLDALQRTIDGLRAHLDAERSGGSTDGPGPADGVRPASASMIAAPDGAPTAGVDRTDRIALIAGDLVHRADAVRRAVPPGWSGDRLPIAAAQLSRTVDDLQGAVTELRARPLEPLLRRMASLARDTARALSREVAVEIDADGVEIDAEIVRRLSSSLTHVVRNAVDHGLEDAQTRAAAGKPPVGRIALAARRTGDYVRLSVSDDGRGIDVDALRARAARSVGHVAHGADVLSLMSVSGLSSREEATEFSGRGVGMDAVARDAAALGAQLRVDTTPGAGTVLTFDLPATIAVQDCMSCRVAGMDVAMPVATIHATRPRDAGMDAEAPIELASLLRPGPRDAAAPGRPRAPEAPAAEIVEVAAPDRPRVAVDRVDGLGRITIRRLPGGIACPDWVIGGAVLEDGSVALVVNPIVLARSATA